MLDGVCNQGWKAEVSVPPKNGSQEIRFFGKIGFLKFRYHLKMGAKKSDFLEKSDFFAIVWMVSEFPLSCTRVLNLMGFCSKIFTLFLSVKNHPQNQFNRHTPVRCRSTHLQKILSKQVFIYILMYNDECLGVGIFFALLEIRFFPKIGFL